MPDMIFVTSSNVEAIGYDIETQELHVRFTKTGATYVYYNVEDWIFEEFKGADSKGIFLNSRIKGHYQESKL